MESSVLLPYQQRWAQDRSQVKIVEKSRRIGLSYAEAADSVLHAAAAGGASVYYISYDKEMTAGFVQDCAQWARAFQAAAGEIQESVIEQGDRQIHTFAIHFDSGHKIQTFSSNPRNLRSKGRPGERLVIDEAAFVDDLAELLKSAMAMTMWGGSVHVISTHNGEENPFNALINDVRAGRYDYSLHRVTLDDALADGLFRRICQVTGRPWTAEAERVWRDSLIGRYRPNEQEELFCVPALGGGSYLPRALVEPCMDAGRVIRFEGSRAFNEAPEPSRAAQMDDWIRDELLPLCKTLDGDRRHTLGMDFARSGDLSVLAPMEIGETLHRTVPFLVELRNVPHKQQEQVLFALGDRLPRLAGVKIDATGNGSYIAEAAHDRWGSLVDQVKFTESWYREEMPPYKAAFEDRTITIPQHDDVLEDHRAFRLVNGVARLPQGKTNQAGTRHGDAAIAMVLAHAASRSEPVSLEDLASTGVPRSSLATAGFMEERRGRPAHHGAGAGWGSVGGGVDTGGF